MSEMLNRILELMKDENINARQLTTVLGISSSSFTDWKNGKGRPSLETVEKIADYFNVSIDYLVKGDVHHPVVTLDFSNPADEELLCKFHQLPPSLQEKLFIYLDGMIAALPESNSEAAKLSV